MPYLLAPLDCPTCRECHQPMAFIAQIPLKKPLPLSETFDMAYVFMCCEKRKTEICWSFDPYSGANAVFFQRGKEGHFGCKEADRFPEYGFEFEKVVEPDVDTDDPSFENFPSDPAREAAIARHGIFFGIYQDDFDEPQELVSSHTKFGGIPFWIQNNDAVPCPKCGGKMELIAQIESELVWPERNIHFARRAFRYLLSPEGEPLRSQGKHVVARVDANGFRFELIKPERRHTAGGFTMACDTTSVTEHRSEEIFPFGGSGVAYAFKCQKECSSTSRVFQWQTT